GPSDAINTTFQNQFLRGTPDNIPATAVGLGSETNGTGTITPTLLDLSPATYDNTNNDTDDATALGGDAKNGVGFFQGYDSNGVRYYYAGIFNGADLGAPLSDVAQVGEWKGRFEVVGGAAPVDIDFTLEVTFGAVAGFSEVAGKVEAFVQFASRTHYHLTGTYDRNGVITGEVDLGNFINADKTMPDPAGGAAARGSGTLNGLIGSNGAIGAFHSTATGERGFSGGFVACPYDTANNRCQQ
ncbi:MAG: hypothetical protein K8953_05515, partial [Proteobacteria bacterium]|nr:hypothetical protein [Pseudomonadota bacterium]